MSDLNWDEIKTLRSDRKQSRVMTLEEVLQQCEGRLAVMIDNKVPGNDTVLFAQVVQLLDKYQLREEALMIGTEASTPFFIGKIRLSCTRQQLEDYQQQPGYDPDDYYLFEGPGRLTQKEVDWAEKERIMTVAAINRPRKPSAPYWQDAMQFIAQCKTRNVRYYQIESEFDSDFVEHP